MQTVLNALDNFLKTLDWPFICGLILLAYFFTKDSLADGLPFRAKALLQRIAKVYRVLAVGVVFAIAEYYLRGYHLDTPEFKRIHLNELMISYFFATSFYELIVDKLLMALNVKE